MNPSKVKKSGGIFGGREMNEWSKSTDYTETNANLVLTACLLSAATTVKCVFVNHNNFVWLDTLSISIAEFTLLFMGIYKYKVGGKRVSFEEWLRTYEDVKKSFISIATGLFTFLMVLLSNWVLRNLNKIPFMSPVRLTEHISSEIFQYPIRLITNYFFYFLGSLSLTMIYAPIVLWVIREYKKTNLN